MYFMRTNQNKRFIRKILKTKTIEEFRDIIDDINPGLLLYIDLWDSQLLQQILKKFNITKEEFENHVMAPLSPIDDFNHYES